MKNLEGRLNNRRSYKGNPLKYYLEHKDKYGGFSRDELSLDDPGLYRSLLRAGQLDTAIPFCLEPSRNKLKPYQIEEIIKSYKPSFGNSRKASKNLHHASETIRKYWRKEGLEIKKGRPRVSEKELKEILRAYKLDNGSISRASEKLHHSPLTIKICWRKEGLEIKSRGRPKKRKK